MIRRENSNTIEQKSHSPLVSVTVPFLNSERFLSEAIASVLSQTYQNWELLLVDDGSIDKSTSIARKFAALCPEKIRYLEHPEHQHRGMSESRNLGLKHSRGDYIAQLDSDDVLSATHLEDNVAIIASNPQVAMTYAPMRIWNSWVASNGLRPDWIQQFDFATDRIIAPPGLIPALLSGRNDPQGVIMRRTQVEAVGGYEKTIRFYADTTIHCKLALKYPVYVSSNCTYWYRQHGGSYCGAVRAAGRFANERMQFYQWLESHLSAGEITDECVHHVLRYSIWKAQHPKIEQCLELPFRIRRSMTRGIKFMLQGHR